MKLTTNNGYPDGHSPVTARPSKQYYLLGIASLSLAGLVIGAETARDPVTGIVVGILVGLAIYWFIRFAQCR